PSWPRPCLEPFWENPPCQDLSGRLPCGPAFWEGVDWFCSAGTGRAALPPAGAVPDAAPAGTRPDCPPAALCGPACAAPVCTAPVCTPPVCTAPVWGSREKTLRPRRLRRLRDFG